MEEESFDNQGDTEISKPGLINKSDSIINKWLNLQKILKESKGLEKMIEKQHSENIKLIKNNFQSFYELKIKSRKLYEDIKNLKISRDWEIITKEKELYFADLEESRGAYFGMADKKIMNIISFIRENYEYIPKIVSLIDKNDSNEEIESLAEFVCNQFYSNILISNSNQEELLICIYRLLEQEIDKMESPNLDSFLEDSTFMRRLINVFSRKPEINNFFVNLLSKVFNEVEIKSYLLKDLSIKKMLEYVEQFEQYKNEKKNKPSRLGNILEVTKSLSELESVEKILENIPRTKINFEKQMGLEDELLREKGFSFNDLSTLLIDEKNILSENEDIGKKQENYNLNYLEELTESSLSKNLKNFFDKDIISFYNHLIEQLNNQFKNPDAFSNKSFFAIFSQDKYSSEQKKIIKIYLKNFLFIQEQIEDIIQSLIDKKETIPFSVRCICTMIDILILKKFPELPKYFRHSFMGKFLFNKCIFPILSLENASGLKNNIFTKRQFNCFKCIINILSKANQCTLFDINKDVEKTMFNYYLLEIIPILNTFYDDLVQMKLPSQLNKLINNSDKIIENKGNYDYFKENSDEIIRIKSVCFNEMDILFIIKLLYKNIDLFKDLPNFDRLRKALKEKDIKNLAGIIQKGKDNREKRKLENVDGKGYYTMFYEEENYQLKELKAIKEKKEEKSVLSTMKNSIKIILRRLNLLNTTEFSYLSFANSNEKFLQALNFSIKNLEESNIDEIPLSWYSKFIVNNENQLPKEYLLDDFEKLYEEIYNEENNYLNKLKSLSPIINSRESININYAENAVKKMKYNLDALEKTKKLEKVRIFIIEDNTELCFSRLAEPEVKKINNNYLEESRYYIIYKPDNCPHISINFLAEMKCKEKPLIHDHTKRINNFISKFKNPRGTTFHKLLEDIKKDILKGEPTHCICTLFEDYMTFLKDSLIKNFKHLIDYEKEVDEIINKIEEYILHKIYIFVFPITPLEKDLTFYKTTKTYDWIPATYFGVKEDIPLEAIQDSISYLLQIEEKAFSIYEKIKCAKIVKNNIKKINEFYFNKKGDSFDDEIGIFTYIVLKAHPKRFISNINYLKCFANFKKYPDFEGFKNMCLVSIETISNVTAESLKMTNEEFNKRKDEAIKEFDAHNK